MNREMTLDELLAEPIVRLLMRRDGVEARELRALAARIRERLEAATQNQPLVPRRVA
jgi:hypothetical protein